MWQGLVIEFHLFTKKCLCGLTMIGTLETYKNKMIMRKLNVDQQTQE